MRVVSLLPSATELICAIGGESLLVGRSHECDEPASIAHLPTLTTPRTTAATSAAIDQQVRDALGADTATNPSLYELDAARLAALEPDVIVTQDLCSVCSIDLDSVRAVAGTLDRTPTIVSLNPHSIEDVMEDAVRLGDALQLRDGAEKAVVAMRDQYWTAIDYVTAYTDGPSVIVLEWMDPLFVAGHWTPQMVNAAGGRHLLNEPGAASRTITIEELVDAAPQMIIVCPCGYDLAATEAELPTLVDQPWWKQLPAVIDDRAVMVDGNQMFSRPGPRLVNAFRWLVSWINDRPEVRPADFPVRPIRRHD